MDEIDKKIAYCGLACIVCGENEACVGCRNDGCRGKDWCKIYNCCREKGLNGCWECTDFPCSDRMPDSLRIRTFARFVKEYGEDELVRCLLRNKANGVVYHYGDGLIGDYDKGSTEDEIIRIIKSGFDRETVSVIYHYDSLVEENNDPVHDPNELQEYMDKWDGQEFIEQLQLSPDKDVLEIGVGTGRLAVKAAPKCREFFGIDISPKTIKRAKKNLAENLNVKLTCGDFMTYGFGGRFDVIYSSLTFMHIKDKQRAINKVSNLLKIDGRFVLSTSKSRDSVLDFGSRKVKLYPEDTETIATCIKNAGMSIEKQFDTEFAEIFVIVKKRKRTVK